MKKQVLTLAAALLASNVSMAASSLQWSADSLSAIKTQASVLSAGAVTVSKSGSEMSGNAFRMVLAETGESMQSTSKKLGSASTAVGESIGNSAQSTSKNISAAAEFVVEKVSYSARTVGGVSQNVATATVRGLRKGGTYVIETSYSASTSIGKAMWETSKAVWHVGKTVVIASGQGGWVLVTTSANGLANILDGNISKGSSTILGSFPASAKKFSSKMRADLPKQK